MRKSFLLIEILLALVLVASITAPLVYILRSRVQKSAKLASQLENKYCFDEMCLRVLEEIKAHPDLLRVLEKRGSLDLAGAHLSLPKNKIRANERGRAYLIEIRKDKCKASFTVKALDREGLRDSLREKRKQEPEADRELQRQEEEGSTTQ